MEFTILYVGRVRVEKMFRHLCFLLLSGSLLPAAALHGQEANAQRVIVAAVRDPESINKFAEVDANVRRMVDRAVAMAVGKPSATEAWKTLVSATDRVLIQVSDAGGPLFSTRPAVLAAVMEGLKSAGVPSKQIRVWAGAKQKEDYDPKALAQAPIHGKLISGDVDFTTKSEDQFSPTSHWARTTGTWCTRIVNLPVFCSHEGCGIAGGVFNLTIRNVDNWRRFVAPPAFGDPYLMDLYASDRIRPKVAITILDGLIAQYAGGPAFLPGHTLHHATIYASRDAVALDTVALSKIEAWRKEAKLPPLAPRGSFLDAGQALGIGIAILDQIDVKEFP